MRAKPCIIGYTIIVALTVAGAQYTAAAPAPPAPTGNGSTAHWKSIQEDTTTWRREPFKAPEETASINRPSAKEGLTGAASAIALQGIMKINKHYYAIINGRTVKPGDRIDGWSVTEISRYRVTLSREKEKQIYDIYQGKIDRGTR